MLFSGELEEPLTGEAFAALAKEKLAAPGVKFCAGDREVKKVFFCSGAGGEYIHLAACRGADAYLTGEMKHHEELEAAASRLTVVTGGPPLPHGEGVRRVFGLVPAQAGCRTRRFCSPRPKGAPMGAL